MGPRGAAALTRAPLHTLGLGRAPNAVVVGARANHLGDEGARAVAATLAAGAALRSLDLRATGIRGRGARALADALEPPGALLRLTLGKGAPRRLKRRIATLLARNILDAPADALTLAPRADVVAIQSVYRVRPRPRAPG
ncbi:MAG: hypothetical protein AB7N76_11560 [Planctomycetota bacterium]